MRNRLTLALIIILVVLHQDFFFADDATLLFGFLPIGLAYHSLYCVAVSVMWLVVIRFEWPTNLVAFAEEADPPEHPEA